MILFLLDIALGASLVWVGLDLLFKPLMALVPWAAYTVGGILLFVGVALIAMACARAWLEDN